MLQQKKNIALYIPLKHKQTRANMAEFMLIKFFITPLNNRPAVLLSPIADTNQIA